MRMANITVIPPREQKPDTLRVAAYCRVSTDAKEQELSYASQIRSYTELIRQHDGWELVDVYADEAVSGTKTEKREDFNRMMSDARKGRIDRVLVKSISRFARNTRDCLTTLRELSKLGVTVQFEKENIDTGTLTTELMVSVSGSLAQQESVSIAQNIRMGYRRRMERGEFITNKPPFGYRNTDGGRLEIIPEEAEIIRWVFASYLDGHSLDWIAEEMNRKGIRKKYGKAAWTRRAVTYWLKNEKYTGNTLCQKTFSSGFPFTKRPNQGELDQFYVEGSHPAIVSQEVFDKAQALLRQKKVCVSKPAKVPLSEKLICGRCGATFYRRVSGSGRSAWYCSRHIDSAASCPAAPIWETDIYTAFMRMYHKLKFHEDVILRPAFDQLKALETAMHRNDPAMLEINRAIAQATERGYKISRLRSNGLLDADACAAQLAANDAELTRLRAKRRLLLRNDDITETIEALRQTADIFHQGPERLSDFDEVLFSELVERITVMSENDLRFRLNGGIEVTETLKEALS